MTGPLLFEGRIPGTDVDGTTARDHEKHGYAGTFTREGNGDPFLPLAVSAGPTQRIELGTAVAIAFARTPMTLAYTGHQLQAMTGGRFVLGLGTQVRAHVERRFSMPFAPPVARMGDHLAALKAIWASWRSGEPLSHEGPFYTHTLMTPAFRPPQHDHADPLILLAAVGPAMTELAATSADGLLTHPVADAAYLREVTLPAVEQVLTRNGRPREQFRVSGTVMVATGRDEQELATSVEALRTRIGFYGSTPAYRPVLAHHGWGDLADRLHELSRSGSSGRWAEMTALVPDEVVRTIGVVAEAESLVAQVRLRYEGLLDRVCVSSLASDGVAVVDQAIADAEAVTR